MNVSQKPSTFHFGLTKQDLGFTIVVVAIILITTAILISDPAKPAFDINSIQKPFLSTLSISILLGLVFATMYAYLLVNNSSFLFIALCWIANLVYTICSMLENTERQKYITFVVALTAEVPLFLAAFSQKQRKWWFPVLPITIILFSVAFYGTSRLSASTTLGVLYLIGPLFSAALLMWLTYALLVREVLGPSVKYVGVYGITFLIIALFQIPFSYQSLCYFEPAFLGCLHRQTILSIGKTAILTAKIANLGVAFFIIKDQLTGLYKKQESAEQQLKQKGEFEELGYFAASVEHELRNPLEVIGGEIEFLKKQTQSNEELQERFVVLEQQLNRMSVAANIINVLRSKREDVVRKMKPLVVVAIVNQATKYVKKELPQETANIFFKVLERTNQSSIEADSALLEQCFVNIFKNSVEAISRAKKTGEIIIEIFLKERRTISITVKDNGDGFVVEDIPQLADPGYTKKTKSTTKSNRGLGLFVCERIVRLHEGEISFSNRKNGGAVVTLEFARYVTKRMQKEVGERYRSESSGG